MYYILSYCTVDWLLLQSNKEESSSVIAFANQKALFFLQSDQTLNGIAPKNTRENAENWSCTRGGPYDMIQRIDIIVVPVQYR
jgi:hypothetical protein